MVRFLEVNKHFWSLETISYFVALLAYSMSRSPSWEANRFSANQEMIHISWNPTVHDRIQKCPPPIPILSHVAPVHAPHPTSWRSILILPSHLCLGLPSGLFPPGFPTKPLYMPPLSPMCYMLRPSHSSRFDHPNNFGWGVQIIKYLIMYSFLHSAVTSSLLRPIILLKSLFSNTLSLRSSPNMRDQVSHPYTKGKIIVLYTLIFIFLGSKLEDKRSCTEW